MTHESIALTTAEGSKSHILIGTITAVGSPKEDTPDIGTANVDIDNYELVKNIPIFYHCEGDEVVSMGNFKVADRVLVLNNESNSNAESMKIVGYEDGLPKSCGWRFKLFRDDDTTIRYAADEGEHKKGDIKEASGVPIELFQLRNIKLYGLYDGDRDYWTALPGNYGWASEYWTYDTKTDLWTYDDSADYPEDWWKGTYNPSTNWFTLKQIETRKSDDDKYWIIFEYSYLNSATDPAENAAVTKTNIDNYIGVWIELTANGNPQILEDPTYKIVGRTFIVKIIKSIITRTIVVNGITLTTGESQGFKWNGSAWIADSSVKLLHGLDTQYPYIYKFEDRYKLKDRVTQGSYEENSPYFEAWRRFLCDPIPSTTPVVGCPGNIGHILVDETSFFSSEFRMYNELKTSIPFKRFYYPYSGAVYKRGMGMTAWAECGSGTYCTTIGATANNEIISLKSDDGLVNYVRPRDAMGSVESEFQDRPTSIETVNVANITVKVLPNSWFYTCSIFEWDEELEEWVRVRFEKRSTSLRYVFANCTRDTQIGFFYK